MFLVKDLIPEYPKNSYESLKKKPNFLKWAKDFNSKDIKWQVTTLKDAQHDQSLEKCKLKPQCNYYYTSNRPLNMKNLWL